MTFYPPSIILENQAGQHTAADTTFRCVRQFLSRDAHVFQECKTAVQHQVKWPSGRLIEPTPDFDEEASARLLGKSALDWRG
jgi:hypothetical protein